MKKTTTTYMIVDAENTDIVLQEFEDRHEAIDAFHKMENTHKIQMRKKVETILIMKPLTDDFSVWC